MFQSIKLSLQLANSKVAFVCIRLFYFLCYFFTGAGGLALLLCSVWFHGCGLWTCWVTWHCLYLSIGLWRLVMCILHSIFLYNFWSSCCHSQDMSHTFISLFGYNIMDALKIFIMCNSCLSVMNKNLLMEYPFRYYICPIHLFKHFMESGK